MKGLLIQDNNQSQGAQPGFTGYFSHFQTWCIQSGTEKHHLESRHLGTTGSTDNPERYEVWIHPCDCERRGPVDIPDKIWEIAMAKRE